eukprot:TRINITY_DN19696_c0_g1_i1.p1 TRINITY_DN19696_c0_g1~~TRINITY_DN19696_c0_g1_i1.p1  ORF type:complete len:264 (+),score=64.32 TRINITY_DN19696_c0_g1_i1:195-986(+)
MPKVKQFITQQAVRWPALEVEYINGRDPELFFLDEFGQPADGTDRLPLINFNDRDIIELLRFHGITPESPKPQFRPRVFTPEGGCVAWRQTGDCIHQGAREPAGDHDCSFQVTGSHSGYCECTENKALPVDCHSRSAWQQHFQPGATAWTKEGEETLWVEPDAELGYTKVEDQMRPYYYNPQERRSMWERPADWKDPRKPFTCAEACRGEGEFASWPASLVSHLEFSHHELEKRKAESAEQQAVAEAAEDDIGAPESWPGDEL